jgi:serine/threonine protein kinase
MYWPVMTDYQEAIQNPSLCFSDFELSEGTVDLDNLGFPRPISGNFASVYGLTFKNSKWAVRCFLKNNPDQEKRYQCISAYLEKIRLPYFVPFKFIREGIRVKGIWYPILKMEWINGESLSAYIEKNLTNPNNIQSLSQKFYALARELEERSIAHGDLQHGNILIVGSEIKLVDYDGMYVPELDGMLSNEIGHPNYQHPVRSEKDFGPYIDRFSEWVIYLSLKALSVDPSLWKNLKGGDENLIFRKADFNSPSSSESFHILETLDNQDLRNIAGLLREVIGCADLQKVPRLDNSSISPFSQNISPPAATLTSSIPSLTPQWVLDYIEVTTKEFSGNMLVERASLGVLVIALLVTLLLFSLGVISSELFFSFAVLEPLLNCVFLYSRYAHCDEIKERQNLIIRSNSIRINISRVNSVIKKNQRKIAEINNEEQEKIEALNQKMKLLTRKEAEETAGVETELRRNLELLNKRLIQLNTDEKHEFGKSLLSVQEKFISDKLTNDPLESASIRGIGDEIKKRLMRVGVISAADILDVHVSVNNRKQHDRVVAFLRVRGKGDVHIDGVGPAKASALLTWRRSLEQQWKVQVPKVVPPEITVQIKTKYDKHRIALNSETSNAMHAANQKKSSIYARFQKDIEKNRDEVYGLIKYYSEKKKDQEEKFTPQYKEKNSLLWEESALEKQISSYHKINIVHFLKRVFTG